MTFPILPSNGPSGYNLTRSLRFRSSASAYLNRTPASSGSLTTMTWSYWVKFGFANTGTDWDMFTAGAADGASIRLLSASNKFRIYDYNGSAFSVNLITTQVFRDPSAWYHIVIAIDSTQATSSNRAKLYVNGSQVTAFDTAVYPSLNQSMYRFNSNVAHNIGRQNFTAAQYFDGYLAEVNFIDGQALTPSSFGSTNTLTGVWQPAPYTGTYGTNGFYLPFTDNSALTTGSNVGLGKDFSGNGNYWATNNISITSGVTYDSMTDVPTLTSPNAANFAVLNPLDAGSECLVANGNLGVTWSSSSGQSVRATQAMTSGKWYWEVVAGANASIGIIKQSLRIVPSSGSLWPGADGFGSGGSYAYAPNGQVVTNSSYSAYGNSLANGDVLGIAFDADNGKIYFSKNGTWQNSGDPATSTNPAFTGITSSVWCPAVGYWTAPTSNNNSFNFGQRPFAYTPPTGFVALNTYNLPDSTIVKGNTVMDATLYTGTGSALSITNAAPFQPDFVWIKRRDGVANHALFDSVRGVRKVLISNATDAEVTETAGTSLTAFNSNGFSLGTNGGAASVNINGSTFVGWQWQAGQGTTSTNTSGTITSTVSVNASAGFSVATFTCPASGNFTWGHGLGVAPAMFIVKSRSSASTNWGVYHQNMTSTPQSYFMQLNTTVAAVNSTTTWANTAPTSSVISMGTNTICNPSDTAVCYAWTPIAGYSAFGSYTGNGSTDGPFVYTGFRPRWVLWKRSSAVGDWILQDTARSPYNASDTVLFPNYSDAETVGGGYPFDILSNGFKLRNSATYANASGSTYIYMAFAENPLKNSLAR